MTYHNIQRDLFRWCASMWTQLPETFDDVPDCSNVRPKAYWEYIRYEKGILCSTYDLFMRSCLSHARLCYEIHGTLSGRFLCCMSEYFPGDAKPPTLWADSYTCPAGGTVQLHVTCGTQPFAFTTTGGYVQNFVWHAPDWAGGSYQITLVDTCLRKSTITITVNRPPDPLPPGSWGEQVSTIVWRGYKGLTAGQTNYPAQAGKPLSSPLPQGWYHIPASETADVIVPQQWVWLPQGSLCFGPYFWTISSTTNQGWYSYDDCILGIAAAFDAVAYPKATRWVPD